MSDRDELIAKARELSAAATPGPWNWANWGDVGDPDDVLEANRPAKDDADRRVWGETVSIKIAKDEDHDLSEADRSFLAESRTLLPALADLAESEGRRADEARDRCYVLERERDEVSNLLDQANRGLDDIGRSMAELMHQRDEARSWVRKLTAETRVLTCVYCGHAYPPGAPTHGADVLTAHIEVCTKHPARRFKAERDAALAELAALKGQQP